jgi:1-acyl-sn-glycerol-3-phosphate acyltransferase
MSATSAHDDPFVSRWLRRIISVPGYMLTWALLVALLPILLPVALLSDAASGSRLPRTRFLAFLVWVTTLDMIGIVGSFATWLYAGPFFLHSEERMLRSNRALQVWWASTLFRGGIRIYKMRVDIDGDPSDQEGGLLVLPRHASLGDTVLPIALMPQMQWRYVLKRELLLHPCLDIVGQRLPDAFVRRGLGGSSREIDKVAALGHDLGQQGAVLIYPEGTRHTAAKQAHIAARLDEKGQPERASEVRKLRHTLPPRLGGILALLETAPEADVAFLAHTGLEQGSQLGDLFRGRLIGGRLAIRLERFARANLPQSPELQSEWLSERWRELDDWIAAQQHELAAEGA